ncbi:HNH endonuclease signature motif containing protein [Ilumatobacter nonamiensis]|uniref:HNH endonuclease signature motif containing protein n=1 Tax=Ilumatobacter nonamiensis TaxID=467093 RepID=UPI00058BC98A|nr:HNH endonuclease signature motif containing protein [Ilumatobacter nonamiensis]
MDRSRTLDAVPGLADALDDATVTAGHVDVVTRMAKGLQPVQRRELFDRVEELVPSAASSTVEQFDRRIRSAVRDIQRDGGAERLERQRRATSMSTWTDDDGMWNVRGRFDPVTALSVSAALDRAVEALFAETVPETCPSDPPEKQKHLRALAFARIACGDVSGRRVGRPEFVAVIDIGGSSPAPADPSARQGPAGRCSPGANVTWPLPIEVPHEVLGEMVVDADVHTVVVRDGVVLHAPGSLNLGRATRLASRGQRRALRALYPECAIPGCGVGFDRCKLHHLVWWRHGGRTDLDNLLPVCSEHHHRIHDAGWVVTMGPRRELTVRFPDGTSRATGPPSIRAG